MKTYIYKSAAVLLLSAGAFTSCVNDDDYSMPNLGCVETNLVANMEAEDIPATTTLQAYEDNLAVQGPDVIEAYVTSSDKGGNFFKSISFQTLDGSFAFSVPVDVTSTFINFEPGRKVLISLDGTYTQIADGALEIGGIFVDDQGFSSVGRLPQTTYQNVLHRTCTVVNEDELVQHTTLSALANDSFLNKLVEIDNVQFVDASVGITYYDENNDLGGATNHLITDRFGNTIVFRTSSFANFAGGIVPDKSGKIRGVLTRFGDTYQFMVRTAEDIMLTEDRFEQAEPFYVEDFQAAVDGTTFNLPGWTNFIEEGTRAWREEAYQGNGYGEFSAFGSNDAVNVAWLVSPAIEFNELTTRILTFKVAQHHLDVDNAENSLQVLVSTDFDGTDVLGATWIPVDANLPVSSTPWYSFLNSSVDVSSLTGSNVYIAFKFIGSGTNTALDGAFQVDDLKAYGE